MTKRLVSFISTMKRIRTMMMISTIYGLEWRDQSVSILVEPFQIKLLTKMMSISKLLMWLRMSHMIITIFSIIIT